MVDFAISLNFLLSFFLSFEDLSNRIRACCSPWFTHAGVLNAILHASTRRYAARNDILARFLCLFQRYSGVLILFFLCCCCYYTVQRILVLFVTSNVCMLAKKRKWEPTAHTKHTRRHAQAPSSFFFPPLFSSIMLTHPINSLLKPVTRRLEKKLVVQQSGRKKKKDHIYV